MQDFMNPPEEGRTPLPEPEALLDAWLESLPEPHILFDRGYRIVAANNAYRQQYGQGAPVLGRTCHAVSHHSAVPCDQAGESCPLARSLLSGQRERVLHLHHTRSGREYVQIELTPLRAGGGEPHFFLERMEPLRIAQGGEGDAPAMLGRAPAFRAALELIARVAPSQANVLLLGESGTGKELAARAVHEASPRAGRALVAVDCASLPESLFESELFGHEKGAFTGATAARAGYFESADGGTLFLDEIGELPLASQVRLLRVLQEREVTRVGATRAKPIDIRVIAATNRVLPDEIREGRFREDLFHRLAVGVLLLPPLRQREGDLNILIDSMLASINAEAASQPGYKHKKLDVSARNLLIQHSWPGNVRELHNTLLRASIWAVGDKITTQDVAESLAVTVAPKADTILGRPLDQAISLPDIIGDVARHYLERAIAQTHGNKSEAARILGIGSYQTLSNWLQKYGVG